MIIEKYKVANISDHLYNYRFNPLSVSGNLSTNPEKIFISNVLTELILQRQTAKSDWLSSGQSDQAEYFLQNMSSLYKNNRKEFLFFIAKRRFYEGHKKLGLKIFFNGLLIAPFAVKPIKDFFYLFRKFIFR